MRAPYVVIMTLFVECMLCAGTMLYAGSCFTSTISPNLCRGSGREVLFQPHLQGRKLKHREVRQLA